VRGCQGGKEGFRTPPGSARILARNLKPRILGFGILGPGKNLSGTGSWNLARRAPEGAAESASAHSAGP
jgi:hypothetical protein